MGLGGRLGGRILALGGRLGGRRLELGGRNLALGGLALDSLASALVGPLPILSDPQSPLWLD